LVAVGLLAAAVGALPAAAADGPVLVSPWATEQAARVRLVAGGAEGPGGARNLYAGLEIQLDDGWKTYWRNPGSSGVPPRIEVTGSDNVASAELLFPAPVRFSGRDGDTIGYKHAVVLPIALRPIDPQKPMKLRIAAEFGLCRDICIPVQPTLSLDLPADASAAPPGAPLATSLARVPRNGTLRPVDPKAVTVKVALGEPKPHVLIDALFPGDKAKGDIFLEAPDGIWIPLPRAAGEAEGGARRFLVDLTDGADLADLKGRPIRMTLVGSDGQSEASFKLE
jgi:DsbC/DsbD-like thiol-disulfide interchange protein